MSVNTINKQADLDSVKLLAWMGGTFDPIHHGHIASALELRQRLELDTIQLMPCHRPAHREQPNVSSQHRLKMVELATANYDSLQADSRELLRHDYSYTADTMAEIATQYASHTTRLCWIMGMDSFANFTQWDRWQSILDLAHLIVMARPETVLAKDSAEYSLLSERRVDSKQGLINSFSGGILPITLTPYPISATEIRAAIRSGNYHSDWIDPNVIHYIKEHNLYQTHRHREV